VDALIDAHRRGVAVRIVLDPGQQHALDRLGALLKTLNWEPCHMESNMIQRSRAIS
jgi:hypothetical protein